jgi:5-formyltetrahydrofolate cyclo-ligase
VRQVSGVDVGLGEGVRVRVGEGVNVDVKGIRVGVGAGWFDGEQAVMYARSVKSVTIHFARRIASLIA